MVVEPDVFLQKCFSIGASTHDLKRAVLHITDNDIPFNIARACGFRQVFALCEVNKDITVIVNPTESTINNEDVHLIDVFKMLKHIAD